MSAETLQFKTELKQLLHLIVHSLYSHKEIFLRELLSNASDAIDTLRFQGLTRPELVAEGTDWKIKLIPNEGAGTLTISDNGIGMTQAEVIENLGTIARSGTRAFIEALQKADAQDRPGLIGQFGVGFYSAFMVADRVTVLTRSAEPGHPAVKWESEGQGEFSVETVEKPTRGTDVVLHLKTEEREYLQDWKLAGIVKQYSNFIEHPIVMDEEKEGKTEEKTLNARKALWLRSKNEITADEYQEFYKHLTHDFEAPAKTIHYIAEGGIEFRALLYIPAHKPFDLMYNEGKKGLQLYIQRVFIMDDCEALLPPYLRFVRGVVDSPDLPLNVSREILQQSAPLEKIKKNLTGKILGTLDEMKRKELESYIHFYEEMGVILKEGLTGRSLDWENRERIADLLLFESTRTEAGKFTTFAEYLERMPVNQEAIWFLAGESRELIENSPALESFKASGQEVLLLTDPWDEFVMQSLREYKGKQLKAADRGAGKDEADASRKEQLQPLLNYLKEKLPEIKDARLSTRLKESAACLVADEHDLGANLERIMARSGRERGLGASKRILEINPDHPAITAIQQLLSRNSGDPRLELYARLLYEQAVIGEGSKVTDPTAFARRINELLLRDAEK